MMAHQMCPTATKTMLLVTDHQTVKNSTISASWTYFACVASGSALLPAAVFSPGSFSIPLSTISLLWERLGLWLDQRWSLGALVERGRRTGRRLQEASDGWMVQHSRVALRGVLWDIEENLGQCFYIVPPHRVADSWLLPSAITPL